MKRCLLIIGVQKDKIEACGFEGKRLKDWVTANVDKYDYSFAIVRVKREGSNFDNSEKDILTNANQGINYMCNKVVGVPGYLFCPSSVDPEIEYHICGISTGASVLTTALAMYSMGHKVKVLAKHCIDRKGKHREAIEILKAYMPGCVE